MNACEQTREALHRGLDSQGAVAQAVRQHLDACPACRAFEQDLIRLERLAREHATAQATAGELPAGLHTRIMRSVAQEPLPRSAAARRPRAGRFALRFAAVAALLIAALLALRPGDPGETGDVPNARPPREVAMTPTAQLPEGSPFNTLRDLNVLPREVQEAPALLASAETSLTSLGHAIFSATGSAMRAVTPAPGTKQPVQRD